MKLYIPFALLALVGLVHCSSEPLGVSLNDPRPTPHSAAEIAFATQVLDDLQDRSFLENREYCGLIGVDASGAFVATPAVRGRRSSCVPGPAFEDMVVLASYHTHGGHSADYDSEVPSSTDLEADMDDAVDGYIATPGGRLWYHDARAESVELICDATCLTQDPDYDEDDVDPFYDQYDLEGLLAREDGE